MGGDVPAAGLDGEEIAPAITSGFDGVLGERYTADFRDDVVLVVPDLPDLA